MALIPGPSAISFLPVWLRLARACVVLLPLLDGCVENFDPNQLTQHDASPDSMVDGSAMDVAADTLDVAHEVAPDSDAMTAGDADASPDVPDLGPCPGCTAPETCCGTACVDLETSTENCGVCGMACPHTACVSGSCTGTCLLGYLNCGEPASMGCPDDSSTDPLNCGRCGHAVGTNEICVGGEPTCMSMFANCDGDQTNGCETNTASDSENCGACRMECGPGQVCAASACTCATGFADCDGMAANGCEVDTRTDVANCGTCATACGMNATCIASVCACTPGFQTCAPAATCTTSTVDPMHCGTCTTACTGGTPVCSSSGCTSGCAGTETLCAGSCVDTTTNVSDCGTCGTACPTPANAVAQCAMGGCGFTCVTGFADCDGMAVNGCEVDLRNDSANCGTCLNGCGPTQYCAAGVCTCPTGAQNCGGGVCAGCCTNADCNDGNACDAHLCVGGSCSNPIACTGATPNCCGAASGCLQCCSNAQCASVGLNLACGPTGACNQCLPGFRACLGDPTSCETHIDSDASNCGACMNVCSFANATATCSAGACVLGACAPGYADCDHNPSNGCEVNLSNNVNNCNACGMVCPGVGAVCMSGACAIGTCMTGVGNCSGTGCTTDLETDPNNCGGCGNACSFPNAAAQCVAGACTLGTCNAGYMDCDSNPVNGCETDVAVDPANCGACHAACSLPNATSGCSASACTVASCSSGFADCNHTASDGCEVSIATSPTHCGACGTTCPNPANASGTCSGGTCGYACNSTFLDCNGLASDGCEVNDATTLTHCGTCSTTCSAVANGTNECEGGSCGGTCSPGFANCNGTLGDGCEVTLATSVANCGACGNLCRNPPNATGTCTSGTCGFTCNGGFGNCDGNALNGCETDLTGDVSHCGSCGNSCGGLTPLCTGSSCQLLAGCPSGRNNCSESCVNEQTDFNNCGGCGHACTASQFCHGGVCITCSAGTTACGGACVTTTSDPANCGACGVACASGQVCGLGVCGPPGDECVSALGLSLATNPVIVAGSTASFTNSTNSCGPGSDVYYRFTLAHRELVYVDTFGSAFDTWVGIVAGPCSTLPTCDDNACTTLQSQLTAVLDAGTYFILVDGAVASVTGNFTLTIEHIAVNGSSPMSTMALPTAFTESGNTGAAGVQNTPGTCGAGPDQWFSWTTCPTDVGGTLDATVCGGATYDTVLQLLDGSAAGGGCNDNACTLQSHLVAPVSAGAGLHVMYVDGSTTTSSGIYTVTGTRP